MMRHFILIISIISILFSCKSIQINDPKYGEDLEIPPGTLKISENFYCDQYEITNFYWREYLYYTASINGKNSTEYKEALPNYELWNSDTCTSEYEEYYLEHPAYSDFPLVGVTKEQAEAYCKWRSDRVFEFLLVRAGLREAPSIIDYKGGEKFTIEDYFKGIQKNAILDTNIKYYPHYYLPSLNERIRILNFADSLNEKYSKRILRKCKNEELPFIHINHTLCADSLDADVTANEITECTYMFAHLRGNVSELSATEGVSFGGSWINKRQEILEKDTFHVVTPNTHTGFRCVFEWRKVEDLKKELGIE